jgi:DNA-directed RNA polymerase subunit RPC12/RpoP
MTRFCVRCSRIIGEKCIQCGTEATASSNGLGVTGADFVCPSCGHHFLQGDGGETGGMCEPCFGAELQKAHEQAAKTGVKDAGLGLATGESLLRRGPARLRFMANPASRTAS